MLLVLFTSSVVAAQDDTLRPATTQLDEVVVRSFESNRRLRQTAAPVSVLGSTALQRFSPISPVQAFATLPGVRLEERSPGSYRVNIRGSSLRSPFGVRNVKVYYNDLPITNPGGHTHLNALGYNNFRRVEVIRGPGGALYGAGTGGVLLIDGVEEDADAGLTVAYNRSSFGGQQAYGSTVTRTLNTLSKVGYEHTTSDGYRRHSAIQRNVLSWSARFRIDSTRSLKTTFLFSDLNYETPGALTKAEWQADSRAFRPGVGVFPSAAGANARFRATAFLAGAAYTQMLLPRLQSSSALYASYTGLRNPAIQNWGRNEEPHAGGRTVLRYTTPTGLTLTGGTEWQQGWTTVAVHDNVQGQAGNLRTEDEIRNRQSFYFLQAEYNWRSWILTAAASHHTLNVDMRRYVPAGAAEVKQRYRQGLSPRLAINRSFRQFSVWASVSRGFTPPTTEELSPSGGTPNFGLSAERGLAYDAGLRGQLFKKLTADLTVFYYRLQDAIVVRRDAGGGSLFVNAGGTRQRGLEAALSYPLFVAASPWSGSRLWSAYTGQFFRYQNFVKDSTNFSGKRMPGVAPHSLSAGFDLIHRSSFAAFITYQYSDALPLNDANTAHAPSYHVLGLKCAYPLPLGIQKFQLFAGADNLFDETYTLGPDINGFGGRYYNAAPGRSFYAGIQWQLTALPSLRKRR